MVLRLNRLLFILLSAALVSTSPAISQSDDIKTAVSKSSFEDVKFELNNAIVNRGLVIDYTGRLADMLARTGKDVGSEKQIYRHAEYVTFCSAKLSRAMMEADPANIAMCPYVIFFYETAAKPGEVVVGYRRPVLRGNDKSKAALKEVDALLAGILKDAAK